jgi:hypothetical protein
MHSARILAGSESAGNICAINASLSGHTSEALHADRPRFSNAEGRANKERAHPCKQLCNAPPEHAHALAVCCHMRPVWAMSLQRCAAQQCLQWRVPCSVIPYYGRLGRQAKRGAHWLEHAIPTVVKLTTNNAYAHSLQEHDNRHKLLPLLLLLLQFAPRTYR